MAKNLRRGLFQSEHESVADGGAFMPAVIRGVFPSAGPLFRSLAGGLSEKTSGTYILTAECL